MDFSMNDKIKNEQIFHDIRFADGLGYRVQEKYYKTVSHAYDHANSLISNLSSNGGIALEYGCSTGDNLKILLDNFELYAVGIDISTKAIEMAEINLSKFKNIAEIYVMDANAPDFNDEKFDFCFGRGILHHLDWTQCIIQLRRILRSEGSFVFIEPLGTNPLINFYRYLTPGDRSPDELPLNKFHLDFLKLVFPSVTFRFYGFLTIFLFKLNQHSSYYKFLFKLTCKLDSYIFKLPFLWRLAWIVVIEGKK
jgi:SAM-dependent methyltransferase